MEQDNYSLDRRESDHNRGIDRMGRLITISTTFMKQIDQIKKASGENVCSVYIFPLNNNFSISKIMQAANEIYYRQNNAFRLNLVWAHTSSQRNGGYRYPITTKIIY